jgi:hypothetical protein
MTDNDAQLHLNHPLDLKGMAVMNDRNALRYFTYQKGVDVVVDFTDTTDDNLRVIGRVDNSSKHAMAFNIPYFFTNLPQFSDPVSTNCYQAKKITDRLPSQPIDTFTQGPWYVGLFNASERPQHFVELVEMVTQFDEILRVLLDFLICMWMRLIFKSSRIVIAAYL